VVPWPAPIEQTSGNKTKTIRKGYEAAIQPGGDCWGGYVFLWGQKQEATSTWFGLFTEQGESTAVVDLMHELWKGKPPSERAPDIATLTSDAAKKEIAAMQTDSTRVMTFRQPVATLLTALDIKVHPHDMSHYHTTLGEKLDASQRRNIAQSELLAGFLDKLKATKEADGSSLFDHLALAYGSNIRTGHELSNCPTIITGRGAGLRLGHNIVAPKDTPLCNVWLTMLNGLGIEAERHGDSTGVVKELIA
jgi:hypothetical protein